LWIDRGGHKGPLRKIFTRKNGTMKMTVLDKTPFAKTTTPLEVKKGALILLHGRLPHYSKENLSSKSRHAYTLHVIDGDKKYPKENWLQRPNLELRGFI
jgi:phytanoyl-CoA hydroxylase